MFRQEHKAGEKAFVDYAGQTVPVVDRETGEVREAQLFVGVLGASNLTFAEATWTQSLPDWTGSHVRMLEYFGGVPESLTLHRLGVFPLVGRSLKTTNVIESVHSMADDRCGRVDHSKNSNQKHRWLATALLNIEPRLRKLLGYRDLPQLRAAIPKELGITHPDSNVHFVA